jgi:hypothetical protein
MMPAISQKQQKFMGLVLAYKRGEVPASKVSKNVKQVAASMSEKELEKYAGTKHKGLPKKVESLSMSETKKTKIRKMVKETVTKFLREGEDQKEETQERVLTPEQKKLYVELIGKYNQFGESIYRQGKLKAAYSNIKKIVEFASKNIVDESGDWFDGMTLSRHTRKMNESFKIFEKTVNEITKLQQRLEAVYEEIGETLGKYYEITEEGEEENPDSVNEKIKK